MQLPPDLRRAIEGAVAATARADLQNAAGDVSRRYRRVGEDGHGGGLQIRSAVEAASYLAVRLPATYCAVTAAFEQMIRLMPDFSPIRMCDAGAGPGTATLAAAALWPGVTDSLLIEPNEHLRAAGDELLRQTRPQLRAAWAGEALGRAGGVSDAPDVAHDLVVMGYMLNEIMQDMGAAAADRTVLSMWARTSGALVLVEPGTPSGQAAVLRARDLLLRAGAHLIAPCPHMAACPVTRAPDGAERWCHFSVRVERSKLHKRVKDGADAPFEDEKFSYIAVARNPVARVQNRLIGAPRGTKVVEAELCRADGSIARVTAGKSSPDYKALRRAAWGDGF